MDKINVLLIEVVGKERDELSKILQNVEYITLTGEVESCQEAEAVLDMKSVDVALLGSKVEADGYKIAEKLYSQNPDLAIIIMEESIQEELLHKAFFSGVKDVLIRPLVPEKVIDSIYQANQHIKKSVALRRESGNKIRRKSGDGQVYTVFGTKGGVGRTFIAINLAIAIQKMTNKRVVLVDLDLDFGNVALALNLVPKFTIADIVDDIRNIDQDLIESYLLPHESGIKVLPSNAQPMMNEFVRPEDIEIILKTLQSAFDYVVIDMPSRFMEKINPAFVMADKLLMIATPEVACLRNTKTALVTLEDLNYPKSKIKLVLNKVDKDDKIKKKDVETTLNSEIVASVVYDGKNVPPSLDIGTPLASTKMPKALRLDFSHLVRRTVDNPELKTLK